MPKKSAAGQRRIDEHGVVGCPAPVQRSEQRSGHGLTGRAHGVGAGQPGDDLVHEELGALAAKDASEENERVGRLEADLDAGDPRDLTELRAVVADDRAGDAVAQRVRGGAPTGASAAASHDRRPPRRVNAWSTSSTSAAPNSSSASAVSPVAGAIPNSAS